MLSDKEVMALQAEALFVHDGQKRIVRLNAPLYIAAPKLLLGLTLEGHVIRLNSELPVGLAARLSALSRSEPIPDIFPRFPARMAEYRRLISEHYEIRQTRIGPAYRFAGDFSNRSRRAVRIDESNRQLLGSSFPEVLAGLESSRPCFAGVRNGMAVSLCYSARLSSRVAEAGVETLTGHRRKGYATEAVAAWAGAVQVMGLMPLYSTSWDNTASMKVAEKLAVRCYGVDFHIT